MWTRLIGTWHMRDCVCADTTLALRARQSLDSATSMKNTVLIVGIIFIAVYGLTLSVLVAWILSLSRRLARVNAGAYAASQPPPEGGDKLATYVVQSAPEGKLAEP